MQTLSERKLVGFVELKVGGFEVKVPIRTAERPLDSDMPLPLARFEVEGDVYAISVRDDTTNDAVKEAVREAAEDAFVHLSRKLLN